LAQLIDRERHCQFGGTDGVQSIVLDVQGAETYLLLAAVGEAAHRTVEDPRIVRLSIEVQQRLANLPLSPPAPSPALEHTRNARSRLIGESR
jgi:hypothetical protein